MKDLKSMNLTKKLLLSGITFGLLLSSNINLTSVGVADEADVKKGPIEDFWGDPVDLLKIPTASKKKVSFKKEIWPLIKDKCLDCHGPDKQKSEYRMDTREAAIKGGEYEEKAIIPGDSLKSPLIHFTAQAVADMEMPPKKKDFLTKEQVALLRAWIDQGAKWGDDEEAPKEKAVEKEKSEKQP